MAARLLGVLSGPNGPIWLAALALALALPSIALPPVLDDHGLRTRLGVERGGPDEAFHLITAGDPRQTGRAAWWSGPTHELHFLRPLAGLTHVIDFRLWPDATAWMRLQNCLLYALLVWLASRCYRLLERDQAAPGPAASAATWGLASLMFAVNDAHGQSLGFIAGRNSFMWALFGLGALLAHHAQRESPSPARAAAGPLAFAGALLSGEAGLATLGYLVAYAACLDDRPRAARLRALVPYAVVLAVWAALYVAGDYGTQGRALYRDPLGDPIHVLVAGIADLPIWSASQLGLAFATATLPANPAAVRLAALVLSLLFALCLWPVLRGSRIARFHGLGFALSLVPLFSTWPQDRLLVLASFGAFGLLANFFTHATTAASRARRIARGALVAVHLGVAPLGFVAGYAVACGIAGAEQRVDAALPSGDAAATTGAVMVRAPLVLTQKYALDRRQARRLPLPVYAYELYSAGGALEVRRVGPASLELTPRAGYCASRVDCGSFDLHRRFAPGRRFTLAAMTVEVLEVDARGAPTRVRFDFPTPLEDPTRRLLHWTPDGIAAFPLPAVGEKVSLTALSPLSALRP